MFCFSYIVLVCKVHNSIIHSTISLIAFLNICVLGDFVRKINFGNLVGHMDKLFEVLFLCGKGTSIFGMNFFLCYISNN